MFHVKAASALTRSGADLHLGRLLSGRLRSTVSSTSAEERVEIMDLGKKILFFSQFMKMTFYGQFVAGEDHKAIKYLIQKNQSFGVGSVLDYSVEEDISEEEPKQKERE